MKEYVLVYGSRRLEACKKLGWKKIPAKIGDALVDANIDDIEIIHNVRTSFSDRDIAPLMSSIKQDGLLQPIGIVDKQATNLKDLIVLNVVENLQRLNTSPIELGKVCEELKNKFGMTLSEIAARFSFPKTKIGYCIDLFNKVPADFKHLVEDLSSSQINKKGRIPSMVAVAILNIKSLKPKEITQLFEETKINEFTQKDIGKIRKLIEAGSTLTEALEKVKDFLIVRIDVPVKKEKMLELEEEYQISRGKILMAMLKGEIHKEKDLFD